MRLPKKLPWPPPAFDDSLILTQRQVEEILKAHRAEVLAALTNDDAAIDAVARAFNDWVGDSDADMYRTPARAALAALKDHATKETNDA